METSAELFEHGIQNENSDVRAHVCPLAKCVYVFQTKEALPVMGLYRKAYATQPQANGPTGLGHCVPIKSIPGLRTLHYQSRPWWNDFSVSMSTSAKGKSAVAVVVELLKLGRFPLWIDGAQDSDNTKLQLLGTDILLYHKTRIQVKCDFSGGIGPGCTGNLFLQTAERNPFSMH